MNILMLGVNHRTASLPLREAVALSGGGGKLDRMYDELAKRYPACERVVLSTCNRMEIYLAGPVEHSAANRQSALWLSGICHVDSEELAGALVCHEDEQAVGHLFEVAGGLDSMVLGEPQVLGQVRRAYEAACARQTVGPMLHKIFQTALATAKQARRQTGIDDGRVSVGSVAVDFARQIFQRFDDKQVACIGAGEMSKLMLQHLKQLHPAAISVTNRSFERAGQLARLLDIEAVPFDQLDRLLIESDIVLTSTGAQQPVITVAHFKSLVRKRRHRPLFLIDIALPRDVEEAVGDLSNVYLYNLDDLQQVVAQTYQQRNDHVSACKAILDEAVTSCMHALRNRDVDRIIKALRCKLHAIGRDETQRTTNKITGAAPEDIAPLLREHTQRLINKVLHLPLSALDRRDPESSLSFYAAALDRLFDLDSARSDPEIQTKPERKIIVQTDK